MVRAGLWATAGTARTQTSTAATDKRNRQRPTRLVLDRVFGINLKDIGVRFQLQINLFRYLRASRRPKLRTRQKALQAKLGGLKRLELLTSTWSIEVSSLISLGCSTLRTVTPSNA